MTLPQLDAYEFFTKILGVGISVALFMIYLLLRLVIGGKRVLLTGQHDEEKLLAKGEVTLRDLQTGPWQLNAQKTMAYASFSLGTLILAVIFIFEQRLTGYDALIFDLVIAVFGASVLAYFVSLQFWFLAADLSGSVESHLKYRRLATLAQSTGWLTIQFAVILSIAVVNTVLGYLASLLFLFAVIFVFEYKARVSMKDEAQQSTQK